MKFKDYLSFKDLIQQNFQDWELEVDKRIENSPLYKKCRIKARPKGYYFKIKKTVSGDKLNSKTKKYFMQCMNKRAQYSNKNVESLIKSIHHPNIKIVRFSKALKIIDSVHINKFFSFRTFSFKEEYTIYFDDLSYLTLKLLLR